MKKMPGPYGYIQRRVLSMVSPRAAVVYMDLCIYERPGGLVFPAIKTIAQNCGASESSVKRALKELEAANLLVIQHRKKPNRSFYSNTYTVIRPQEEISKQQFKFGPRWVQPGPNN